MLEENKIKLRLINNSESDYKYLEKWYQEKEIYSHFEQRILNYEEIKKKYSKRTSKHSQIPVYMIEYSNVPIGIIQYQIVNENNKKLYNIRGNKIFEVDIFIGDLKLHNKGIGSIVVKLMTNYLITEKRADKIVMCPLKENTNAIKCYKKCGFIITNEFKTEDTIGNIQNYIVMTFNNKNKYYQAYDLRYKQVHSIGELWEYQENTKEVLEFLKNNNAKKSDNILELGCGEGRDAIYLLNRGYFNLLAVDYSKEAINTCNILTNNKYNNKFKQFDLIEDELNKKFKFIYSISVLHMFVLKEHRNKYWQFIYNHLEDNGKALITVLGNGIDTRETKPEEAFDKSKRIIQSSNKEVEVVNTSCKIITWDKLKKEVNSNNLKIIKSWISYDIPGFNNSMCVVVEK